jgi:mannosyltransferase OCH1-like enzyme
MAIKLIHYIWIGSRILNTEENPDVGIIASWARLNPDWRVNLWVVRAKLNASAQTQIEAVARNFGVTIRDCTKEDTRVLVGLNDQFVHEVDTKFPNYGAASDILRVAILIREGGLYVDHELVPVKPLGNLLAPKGFLVHMIHSCPANDILYSEMVAHGFFLKYRSIMVDNYANASASVKKARRTDRDVKSQTTQEWTGPGALYDALRATNYTSDNFPAPAAISFPEDRLRPQEGSSESWL